MRPLRPLCSTTPHHPLLSPPQSLLPRTILGRSLYCSRFLRFFSFFFQSCIGFTKKQDNQIKQTCYAQASQIRAVRKKMCDIMSEEASKCDLRELVLKL